MKDFVKLVKASMAGVAVVLCALSSSAQGLPGSANSLGGGTSMKAARAANGGSASPAMFTRRASPYTLPDPYARRLIGQFSVGEVRDNGIFTQSLLAGTPSLSYNDVSTSIAYDLRQRRADYVLDYRVSARHYRRFSQLDVVTHDLSLAQVVDLSPRTRWTLSHRYSSTPDLAGSLMAETLSRQLSFINPLPSVAVAGRGPADAGFMNPLPAGTSVVAHGFQPLLSPAEGLLTLRSLQTTNLSRANLSVDMGPRTNFAFEAGFSRVRFDDKNLFSDNQYSVSASLSRLLGPRASIGLSFRGTRFDLTQVFQRTLSEAVMIEFTKQIGRRSAFSLEAGPSRTTVAGQQAIPLPSALANLLGTPALVRKTSQADLGWLGAATLASNIHDVGVRLGYTRAITGTGGLGGSSLTETGAIDLSKNFRQRTRVSGGISYARLHMLGLVNPITVYQQGLSFTLTRMVSRAMDVSTFFIYAKSTNGSRGPSLLNHNQVGVRFVYNFRRLNATGAGM